MKLCLNKHEQYEHTDLCAETKSKSVHQITHGKLTCVIQSLNMATINHECWGDGDEFANPHNDVKLNSILNIVHIEIFT